MQSTSLIYHSCDICLLFVFSTFGNNNVSELNQPYYTKIQIIIYTITLSCAPPNLVHESL